MTKQQYRRATAGARFVRMDPVSGHLVKLRADELGVIPITTAPERRVADAIGLRVTRVPRLDNDEVAALKKDG